MKNIVAIFVLGVLAFAIAAVPQNTTDSPTLQPTQDWCTYSIPPEQNPYHDGLELIVPGKCYTRNSCVFNDDDDPIWNCDCAIQFAECLRQYGCLGDAHSWDSPDCSLCTHPSDCTNAMTPQPATIAPAHNRTEVRIK
eukprot:TRINITY_DN23660_c0_g1_i1.p1 TRINITY_DN23660_c0_g1~~TRINITY_DN23660_c0_g1_i1.p1  ORF type:complete len:138 (+),score=0.72 TRINITY_DN23660_c0_g1_i1:112-525(+)